jgi:hypothetical protein
VLGASGAIAGVLGCYMGLFPFARVIILVPILFVPLFFEVPAMAFIGVWFLIQVVQGIADLFTSPVAGGVASWAHVAASSPDSSSSPSFSGKNRATAPTTATKAFSDSIRRGCDDLLSLA